MDSIRQEPYPSFSDQPYEKRWEPLKPFLDQLYIIERKSVNEVVDVMKVRHRFYATCNQYKRKFHAWGWSKSVPTIKKEAICKQLQTRAQQGKHSVTTYRGQPIDTKQLRRYLKSKARQESAIGPILGAVRFDILELSGHSLQCGNRVFLNWNIPFFELVHAQLHPFSPFGHAPTPSSDVLITTPSSAQITHSPYATNSPRDALSPKTAPSPTTVALIDTSKIQRANLFIQGRHVELLKEVMTNWMHQFWLFSFKTAKHWNKGPQRWTSSMLGFDDDPRLSGQEQLVETHFNANSSGEASYRQLNNCESDDRILAALVPTLLCQWAIHVREESYTAVPSPPAETAFLDINLDDEGSWKPWAAPQSINEFAAALKINLESNEFSSVQQKDLPVSTSLILGAAERSPDELLQESLGFAIMGRNTEMIVELMQREELPGLVKGCVKGGLYPLHLATSYLDGSKTCCNLFVALVEGLPTGDASVRKIYINHLGHTVLDNLMIAILKAHTSCSPGAVDDSFKKEQRFAGEEVDICGRWDADSKCISHFNASYGDSPIPFRWKHMFCHTSIQTICHCIGAIFGPDWGPDVNTPSGIFTKRCSNESCGRKLQLFPLHTLVVVAMNLAVLGSNGETLFGMLSCLLCLLSYGANPSLKAEISLKALLGDEDDVNECSHEELDPVELAEKVPDSLISRWPLHVQVGWRLFCRVLNLSREEWLPKSNQGEQESSLDFLEFIRDINFRGVDEINLGLYEDEDDGATHPDDSDKPDAESEHCFPACCYHSIWECHKNYFGVNRDLAILWASVQAEFTTYRRIQEDDPWTSANFDMISILSALESGIRLDSCIRLIAHSMIENYCQCGTFYDADDYVCVRSEELSTRHFSNLEDWTRSGFIETPAYRMEGWMDSSEPYLG